MTIREQKEAMLELMGYKRTPKQRWISPTGTTNSFEDIDRISDYVTDPSAVAQAERSLLWHDECLVEKYEKALKREYLREVGYQGYSYWFMAGPTIRARAMLKTLKKWKGK